MHPNSPDWWRLAFAWVLTLSESLTQSNVLFVLGATYTVLNIVVLVRREFGKRKGENAPQ